MSTRTVTFHKRMGKHTRPKPKSARHGRHKHKVRAIKWASAGTFVVGSALEHWTSLAIVGVVLLAVHVVMWVLAD